MSGEKICPLACTVLRGVESAFARKSDDRKELKTIVGGFTSELEQTL